MPRNGGGVYSRPAGTTAVPNTVIESAKFEALVTDIIADLNLARPISAGGTGSTTAADSRTALGISATNTPFTPAGNIAATDVQAALAELDTIAANTYTKTEADARYLGDTYRNRIVNPAMQISQEYGSTLVDVTTGGVYTVDQWGVALNVTPGGTLRVQQVASATPGGSPFRLRHTAQVADASIAAGDVYIIVQNIEGQMIADARFGTASARQIVIRFGVRSSLAGTFGVLLTNSAYNRSYVTTITIAGGEINTDLVRTVVIPGDTSGTWLTDTGIGLALHITLAAGTTFQTTAGSWQAGNFMTTSAQTNFMGTASATFELFDVGLYVDALAIGVAPPFEVPAWDADFRACQRYWRQFTDVRAEGSATAFGAKTYQTVSFNRMRIVPAGSATFGTGINTSGAIIFNVTDNSAQIEVAAVAAGGFAVTATTITLNARF